MCCSSRAKLALVCQSWREGNESVAEFMLQKVVENDQLALLLPRDRESLAAKLLEIGKSLLRPNSADSHPSPRGVPARDAVRWLQKAFTIIENVEHGEEQCGKELKRSILRSLARAYFLSSTEVPENLIRAETSLNELIESIDAAEETSSEYQQLRWMRIAVLKKRKAAQPVLLDAFRSIIDHMVVSENNITDALVTAVHQFCLQRLLDAQDISPPNHIDRLLLSFVFHCSKDADHSRAMQDLSGLIWQFGDRQYQARRWSAAADWYIAGTHKAFGSIASLSHSKCFRKAALCHIQQGDYAIAAAVIRRCPDHEAATQYIKLLTAVHQAIDAVKRMAAASDFNRKMLLLATQLANEFDMKKVLLSVLEALLHTVQSSDGNDLGHDTVTLIRCIIRLVLKLMAEPGADRTVLVPVLIRHFNSGGAGQSVARFSKDISWLWRTAYNCAIQGCTEWHNSEDRVAELFDIARQFLETYRDSVLTDVDAEIHVHIINASFAAIAGRGVDRRVFFSSEPLAHPKSSHSLLRPLLDDIAASKKRIRSIIDNKKVDRDESTRAEPFLHVLRVFETELLSRLREWGRLLSIIEEVVGCNTLALSTLEAITDILWVEGECPIDVLFAALEAILHASLDRSLFSIDKFSRWLRAICSMLLSRNSAADRAKAIGYVEQAIHVIENQATDAASEGYPLDERQWLLGTSYNTGIECLQQIRLMVADQFSVRHYWMRQNGGSKRPRQYAVFSQMAMAGQKR
ncbi:hypothetical protein POSPLADRAFT_1064401 [Postia placenta MAD-698-R-SB12]|uniref:Protein ZIP4 homolog n=1 Tax=Postia placenta MAD-698-R-SB12 TaxID=670580 RepID=A0A1X6NHD4_9APHY|nr:hypothetical protein POSPLADRAFT_1064401 [Postia placenta MAD-698-R-SB12]OSX68031.1 hypothetical protein POSPLADRAFT_1064401 [Postia placenta MAD-698-R-SB12]